MNSNSLKSVLLSIVGVISVAVVVVCLWSLLVSTLDLPKILLPSPMQVAQVALQEAKTLCLGAYVTGITATVGLGCAAIVGIGLSVVFSQSMILRRALFPYVVFLQTVPIVAIAPLLVIWSGYTIRSAVIATLIICLFPIINNTTTGLMTIRRDHEELFSLYGAGRWRRLISLQFPAAIPHVMLGLRISSGLAVIGAIVAEFFVSNGASTYSGLGALMSDWQGRSRTDALMAALFASAILGLLLFGIVELLSATVFRRWTRVPA